MVRSSSGRASSWSRGGRVPDGPGSSPGGSRSARRRVGPDLGSRVRGGSTSYCKTMSTNSASSPSWRSQYRSMAGRPIRWPMPARCMPGVSSATTTGPPARVTRRISRKRRGMILEVGEAADRVAGVEGLVGEGEAFGLGPGQPASHPGEAVAAGDELRPRDVDSVDRPGLGQEPRGSPRRRCPPPARARRGDSSAERCRRIDIRARLAPP